MVHYNFAQHQQPPQASESLLVCKLYRVQRLKTPPQLFTVDVLKNEQFYIILRILKGYVLSQSRQVVNIQNTTKPIHGYTQALLIPCKIFLIYYNLIAN